MYFNQQNFIKINSEFLFGHIILYYVYKHVYLFKPINYYLYKSLNKIFFSLKYFKINKFHVQHYFTHKIYDL